MRRGPLAAVPATVIEVVWLRHLRSVLGCEACPGEYARLLPEN
jgi:hypothetical protein